MFFSIWRIIPLENHLKKKATVIATSRVVLKHRNFYHCYSRSINLQEVDQPTLVSYYRSSLHYFDPVLQTENVTERTLFSKSILIRVSWIWFVRFSEYIAIFIYRTFYPIDSFLISDSDIIYVDIDLPQWRKSLSTAASIIFPFRLSTLLFFSPVI